MPQVAGMVQGKQDRKVVGPRYAPAGPVVFHPAPNNSEDVALHAPHRAGCGPSLGSGGFSFPLVVRHQCVFEVAEVGKQFPPFLLFVRIQCAFNGCLHHSKGFLYLAFTEQAQDGLLEIRVIHIGTHSPVSVELVQLEDTHWHHVFLEPTCAVAVKGPLFHTVQILEVCHCTLGMVPEVFSLRHAGVRNFVGKTSPPAASL